MAAMSPLHTPLRGSRANARGSSGGADSRILTALFLGVAAGALASTVTEWARPSPGPIGKYGTECPRCDGPGAFDAMSGHPPARLSKYATLHDAEHAGDAGSGSSARALSVGGDNAGLMPGVWWTPETAPAATGADNVP